jgi:hypothetical protein
MEARQLGKTRCRFALPRESCGCEASTPQPLGGYSLRSVCVESSDQDGIPLQPAKAALNASAISNLATTFI